ncbi:phosphoribosyltransferase [Candidatus Peregrinibacteria bacterium CG11_big_fil_rev_8_21_14_0_20_46_8]|nr:MAG: phosphoribosyltransferase [Candidatus Peregrinibacteria bacterium CG11_big_fil_rev_8_21_14_0_20_46_8]
MKYKDRAEAGALLADQLKKYLRMENTIVLGLPRGGVITAFEVAKKLQLPLDITVVRKIGARQNPEFAIGAIDENGKGLFSEAPPQHIVEDEKKEAARRIQTYRGNRPPIDLKGKTAILVDDGIATGFTMRAAIRSAKTKGAEKIVAATPIASPSTIAELRKEADEVIALSSPASFIAVGQFYEYFPQTTDEEVIDALYKKPNLDR